MDTYINLGTRFRLNSHKRELIDMHTGEIHTEEEDIKKLLSQLKKDKEFNRSMEKAIRDTWELKTALELYQQKWKDDSWFIKIYRTEMREYKKLVKLSSSAGLLLFYIQDYIEYKTNRIVNKNSKSFTNKELAELAGISENTLIKALNELEDKQFIKRVGNKRAREFYFNPFLATSGNEVDKDIIKMFKNYEPITPF